MYVVVVVEVVATDEFREWWDALDNEDAANVARIVDLLEAEGIALGFPYVPRAEAVWEQYLAEEKARRG